MKLSDKEKDEVRKFVEENKDSIDQNFWAYRKAMAEKESDAEKSPE